MIAVCRMAYVVHHVVTTSCGVTTTAADATAWETDVTCRFCLTHTKQRSDDDEARDAWRRETSSGPPSSTTATQPPNPHTHRPKLANRNTDGANT